jgi:hypothetical protein
MAARSETLSRIMALEAQNFKHNLQIRRFTHHQNSTQD